MSTNAAPALDDDWARTALALRLLTLPGSDLGGAVIRMRAGPQRDAVLRGIASLHARKIHPAISDEQLFGGLDLSATLSAGHFVENRGVFDEKTNAILTMAERCPAELAAKLAQILDLDRGHMIVALDEGAEPDEHTPAALSDRLALQISPDGRLPDGWPDPVAPPSTRQTSPRRVRVCSGDIDVLTRLADAFGIDSLRAPLLALRVAKAHAALHGSSDLREEDLHVAAQLTYPHKATRLPQTEETDMPPPPSNDDVPDAENKDAPDSNALPEGDMLVEAVRALLPADLLAGLVPAGTTQRAGGTGAGQKRKGNRRGRPLPSRPGRLDGRTRVDLVATLRAAAPWQPLRQAALPARSGLHIRPSDVRLKRYQSHSDRLLVFAVDASGSSAVSRLNEAKGAVELLLGQAYAARDHVALIAFRGEEAELLLPPTRSLVQTKKRLAALPGGGGTPLAAGLLQAGVVADQNRARGLSPTVVLLTDGRANVSLSGSADRAAAQTDAEQVAFSYKARNIPALVIDTSNRPQEPLKLLAGHLGAPYIALPRADAQRLTGAVSIALAR